EDRESTVLRMRLAGANAEPGVSGVDELPGKSNYFIGSDPAKWRTNIPTYAKVRYRDVYSGIDLVYYGNGRQLQNDFVVSAGADPSVIRVGFEGSRHVSMDSDGNLDVQASGGDLRLLKPVAYQRVSGQRTEVAADYELREHGQVGFKVGS